MATQPYYCGSGSDEAPRNFTPLSKNISPSNPIVAEILQLLRDRKNGTFFGGEPWFKRILKPNEYDELLQLIRNDESLWVYMKTKLRYDYDPTSNTLVIRMPTGLHEYFSRKISSTILKRLDAIAEDSGNTEVISFVKDIRQLGSSKIYFKSKDKTSTIEHEPDDMFRKYGEAWPSVILEISYSQKQRDVCNLARNYILLSRGRIKVVLGLDIEYGKENIGTLSVWHQELFTTNQGLPGIRAVQTLVNQVFRDSNGAPNLSQDAGLRLNLADFASGNESNSINDAGGFFIDSATLCELLYEAEEEWRTTKEHTGKAPLTEVEKITFLEDAPATPPHEELNSEDEEKFEEEERRALRRAEDEDDGYEASNRTKRISLKQLLQHVDYSALLRGYITMDTDRVYHDG